MGGSSSKKEPDTTPEQNQGSQVKAKTQEEIKNQLFSGKNLESAATKASVDAVFLCDCTGSMSSFIEAAKATVRKMVSDFREQYSQSSIFVGFVAYRDHGDSDLLQTLELTGDMEEVYKFINKLGADGGNDTPEAVADALNVAANKMQWREGSLRLLIHICDAPCHGKKYHECDDTYPGGCPCKLDPDKLLKNLSDLDTQYILMSFGNLTNKMAGVFKQFHKDFTQVKLDEEKMSHEEEESVKRHRYEFGESMERQEEMRMASSSYQAADKMICKTSAMVQERFKSKMSHK